MTGGRLPWVALTDGAESAIAGTLSLRHVDLPPHLHVREGVWKGERVSIRTHAYTGGPLRYARFSVVASPALEIGNILCVPRADVPLPILGADLVAIRSDTGMAAIDLSPTLPAGHERDRQLAVLKASRAHHPVLPDGGQLPAWCATWFSPHALYTRGTPIELAPVASVVNDFIQVFIDLALGTSPLPECACTVGDACRGYMAAHRTDDKGLNLLGKMFGQEWAEDYVESVLFPDMPEP